MSEPKDSFAKVEEAQAKWRGTEKGKEATKRWNNSDAGKESRERYLKSEKGQEALLRYYLSERAESTRQKRQALIKLFRKLDKYLKLYPDNTIEDFLNQL